MMRILLTLTFALFCGSLAQANVLGDMQTFAPSTDGLDFITVHTSRPLNKGFFAFGGHFSYARNHLLVFKDLNTQEKYDYKHRLGEFDFDMAYALTDKFSLTFAAPNLIYDDSDSGQPVVVEVTKGTHTYRPGFKWTLPVWNLAFLTSIDFMNVTDNPYTGQDDHPIYNFEFAKTLRARNTVAYGLNLGYRFRSPSDRPATGRMFPLDDQITFSMGRSAPFIQKSRWVLEGIFSLPVDKKPYKEGKDASSIDVLLGFKHRLMKNLNLDWGGTFEPFVETLSPEYRVFAGLVYYFNPGWTDSNRDATPPPVPTPLPEEKDDSQTEAKSALFEPLEVTPMTAEVFEGSTVHYKVKGGVGPYTFRIIKGDGRVNAAKATYRTPLHPEVAEIEIGDSNHQTVIVIVVVKTPPKPNETIRIKNLNFIFDTDILVKSSRKEISRIVDLFSKKQVSRIIVEGHTDSKGSDDYNQELSERRAETVRRLLIEGLNLKDDQVNAIGFGEARPIATNNTEKGRLMNRRVDLKVYYR